MVDLADSAWHACTFNRRSIGIEMSGSASRGFDARFGRSGVGTRLRER